MPLLLLLLAAAVLAPPAGGQLEEDRGGLAYEPSTWWERIEKDVDPLIAKERWKKARRKAEELSDEIVRFSWRAPDIGEVLAAVAVRRAAIEAVLGREETALWLWWSALNLDPSVEPHPAAEELFRAHPLREEGRLPDDAPPPQAPDSGYEPPVYDAPDGEFPFYSSSAMRVDHLPVSVEVVVQPDGRLTHPLVLSTWTEPVPTFWTLETIHEELPRVEPARLDGEPVATVERIEMRFDDPKRW